MLWPALCPASRHPASSNSAVSLLSCVQSHPLSSQNWNLTASAIGLLLQPSSMQQKFHSAPCALSDAMLKGVKSMCKVGEVLAGAHNTLILSPRPQNQLFQEGQSEWSIR